MCRCSCEGCEEGFHCGLATNNCPIVVAANDGTPPPYSKGDRVVYKGRGPATVQEAFRNRFGGWSVSVVCDDRLSALSAAPAEFFFPLKGAHGTPVEMEQALEHILTVAEHGEAEGVALEVRSLARKALGREGVKECALCREVAEQLTDEGVCQNVRLCHLRIEAERPVRPEVERADVERAHSWLLENSNDDALLVSSEALAKRLAVVLADVRREALAGVEPQNETTATRDIYDEAAQPLQVILSESSNLVQWARRQDLVKADASIAAIERGVERLAGVLRRRRSEATTTTCNACKVEAEFGTQEDPHPVPAWMHKCAGAPTWQRPSGEEGPFPSVYNVDVPEGQWAVEVRGGGDADYKTVFASGVQAFTIAEYPADGGKEAREACEWFAGRFRTAMLNLGAPPERAHKLCAACAVGAHDRCTDPDCRCAVVTPHNAQVRLDTGRARLDPDGTAKPKTGIVAVMPPCDDPSDYGRTVHVGQATHYIVRPTEAANDSTDSLPDSGHE